MIEQTNRTKFLKAKDAKEKTVTKHVDMSIEERTRALQLIWKYRNMWEGMASFRARRRRNKEYFNGNQWNDYITGKDGKKYPVLYCPFCGQKIDYDTKKE